MVVRTMVPANECNSNRAESGTPVEPLNTIQPGSLTADPVKVLIIEDEEAHFQLMKRAICKELPEARVSHAPNAAECLEGIDRIDPDIILVDFLMPGMTGIEFLANIKKMGCDVPIIMITGQGDERIAVQAMKLGAHDYLVKSADFFHLLPAVVGQAARERKLQLHLHKVARLNELLLDSLPYPAMMIRRDRMILAANRIALEMGARVGTPCWQSFGLAECSPGPQAVPAHCLSCRAEGAFQTGKAIHAPEIGIGEKTWETWWIPIDPEVCLIYAIDITKRRQDQEKLNDLNRALIERTKLAEQRAVYIQQLAMELSKAEERERNRLSAILHDDFQQMLAYLKLKLHTLAKGGQMAEDMVAMTTLIGEGIERCRDLARELRPIVSRQDDFGAGLVSLCRQMKEMYDLHVSLQMPPDPGIHSAVLSSLLIRSIRELLFNVVKHSGGKRAAIEVKLDGTQMLIFVSDQGSGCNLRALREKREKNLSFGLFDIEDRVRFLGGEMQIESEAQKGFQVTLKVPCDVPGILRGEATDDEKVAPAKPKTENPQALPAISESSLPIKILLADDHDLMREGLARMLQGQGAFKVVGLAADGRQAVRMASEVRPDVILMDFSMPVMNGVDAAREISRSSPEICIIGLTMHHNPKVKRAMLNAGACACLSKAVSPEELVVEIQSAFLSKHKAPSALVSG